MRKIGLSFGLVILLLLSSLLSACNTKQTSPTPFIPPQDAIPTSAFNSPTLTPVPVEITPPEEPRLKDADLALSFGDYEKALELYRAPIPDNSATSQAAALFGQSLALFKQGNLSEARTVMADLATRFPTEAPGVRALFWLGEYANSAGETAQAIEYYAQYQEKSARNLDAMVFEKIGDMQSGPEQKLIFYQKAYSAAGNDPSLGLVSKLAEQYNNTGQADRALEVLQLELESSTLDYSKAFLLLQMGDIEIRIGNTEAGNNHYLSAVNNYPLTGSGYSALAALVNANVPVNELARGIINYNVDQDKLAIEALDRYLTDATESIDKALYYKALATRRLGTQSTPLGSEDREKANLLGGLQSDKEAIALWTRQIKEFPNSEFFVDAMEDVIYTQYAYMDQTMPAIETAEKYIAEAPNADYVPRLLNMASQYYQALGQEDKSIETLTRIGMQFPGSDLAFSSLFFSGIIHYRNNQLDKANEVFNRALLLAYIPEDSKEGSLEQAGAYLWLGKTALKKGDAEAAKAFLQDAQNADKYGYYGLRAGEILAGKETFAEPANLNFEVDLVKERQRAALWLATLMKIPPETNLDFTQALFEEPDYLKGMECFKLGLFTEAASYLASLRNRYSKDAINSFRLIKVFYDLGYYDQAILAASTVVKLTGYAYDLLSPNLPPYFAYIEYGTYYLTWVQQYAERYNVPVLVLLSLIRQESLFQANAVSSAGALGLMQLMPATGSQIALESNWPPDFTTEDLQIAYVSLVLGSNYLGRQLIGFQGDTLAALAAYNAGPGSVLGWKATAGDDPDVFVGTIRYLETRTYVRKVAENYEHYVRIYGNP
ncbi:MAG TPA: transglycosylase SLT domain-containing protein [Anaerolineaceae bacterium]|nr:transglycosylase SLT domain-containing protein [Anaerolineaceae bacterium]